MNIPLQKLLTKMDAELQGAKTAYSNAALRERIHSLKTLCELVLDEPVSRVEEQRWQPTQTVVQAQAPVQTPTPMSVSVQAQQQQQQKRLEMEDGANGESLLDF